MSKTDIKIEILLPYNGDYGYQSHNLLADKSYQK